MEDPDDPRGSTVRLRQIRFVPFEIGTEISNDLMKEIREAMSNNNYKEYELNKYEDFLPKDVCAYNISDRHQLFIFKNGICVSVLTDDKQDSGVFFSINCCLERRDAHRGILKLDGSVEEKYRKDGEEIRKIAKLLIDQTDGYIKGIKWSKRGQKTALTRWEGFLSELDKSEYGGLSYVMTMHVITPAGEAQFGNLAWNDISEQMRRNIKVLLDPAILNIEDTRVFDNEDINDKKKLFANINVNDEEKDYEKRENLATFMSWSSVIVLGVPTEDVKENDIEEYKILEVMLQSNWYLVHSREKALPLTIDDAKNKNLTSAEIRMNQYILDRYLEETTYHSGSTLPARFNEIQNGLLRSSRLTEKTSRYKRMAKDMSDCLKDDDQLTQSKHGWVSEVLALLVAIMNVTSITYSIANKTYEITIIVFLITFVAIGVFIYWKNRR